MLRVENMKAMSLQRMLNLRNEPLYPFDVFGVK